MILSIKVLTHRIDLPTKIFFFRSFYRRRVRQASERGTIRPTRCADVVVVLLITSRSHDVLSVAIPLSAFATVSFTLVVHLLGNLNETVLFDSDTWSVKAKRRKTTGTGRMRHLDIVRRYCDD